MIFAAIHGPIQPVYGIFIPEAVFAMMKVDYGTPESYELMWDDTMFWIAFMAGFSVLIFIVAYY